MSITEIDHDVINRTLLELDEAEEGEFRVLHDSQSQSTSTRSLLIIIHPGDVLQNPRAWSNNPPEDYRQVYLNSMTHQEGMAIEIADRLHDGWDVVTLHRGSCSQFALGPNRWIHSEYLFGIYQARTRGPVLYGDDTAAAAAWMNANLNIAGRPEIFMLGAYNDPENGCINAVADRLAHPKKITISAHAPRDNS